MGKGKSDKSTTNEPWSEAKPYLLGGANTLNNAYNDNAGAIQNATNQVGSLLPSVIDKYKAGNQAINSAQNYNVDVLGGKYLGQGNPYLQQMIDQTGNDVRNQSQAALGLRGLTGGSSYADIISRNLANNSTNLRYTDYTNERNQMSQAAGQAPGLAAADTLQINPIMSLLNAYQTPVNTAANYAGSLGGLLGGYGKKTESPSAMDTIGQGLTAIGSIAKLFPSDLRLKTDVLRTGTTEGGLPVYRYRYTAQAREIFGVPVGDMFEGVMAQDVARLQPEALGPEVDGFKTVDYAEVR